MYSAMFTLFPFTQTYTKKKHEVLDFINQMASVNGFVCFCPRGPIINMVRSMTAGRDSTGVMTAFFCIRLLVKYNDEIYVLFARSFVKRFSQSVEELTQQPEQHHRVVILQLPLSLDGGLKSQSVIILLYCFLNCLTKALMPQPSYNTGETSSALLFLTSKTFFSIQSRITPQDVSTSITAIAVILRLKLKLVSVIYLRSSSSAAKTFEHCKYTVGANLLISITVLRARKSNFDTFLIGQSL